MSVVVFADFNNADSYGRLRLNSKGSLDDIRENNLNLDPGMTISVSDGDMITEGIVEYSSEEDIWVARIDWDQCIEVNSLD